MMRWLWLISAIFSGTAGAQAIIDWRALTVLGPSQSKVDRVVVPREGAIIVKWTPAKNPTIPSRPLLLNNHFVKHDSGGELRLRVHYETYSAPVLELHLDWKVALRGNPLAPFERGRTYEVIAFWRDAPGRPGQTECGIFLKRENESGNLIAHSLVGQFHPPAAKIPLRVGAEKASSTIDPTFPSVHWVDGQMDFQLYNLEGRI